MPCHLINEFCKLALLHKDAPLEELFNRFMQAYGADEFAGGIIEDRALLFIKAAETARGAPPSVQRSILDYDKR